MLFWTTSICPKAARVLSTAELTSSSTSMSATAARARPPACRIASAALSAASSTRSTTTTAAPSAANVAAHAYPMPCTPGGPSPECPPPKTTAVRPASRSDTAHPREPVAATRQCAPDRAHPTSEGGDLSEHHLDNLNLDAFRSTRTRPTVSRTHLQLTGCWRGARRAMGGYVSLWDVDRPVRTSGTS